MVRMEKVDGSDTEKQRHSTWNLKSDTCRFVPAPNVRDQVSRPYKTGGKIIILCILYIFG